MQSDTTRAMLACQWPMWRVWVAAWHAGHRPQADQNFSILFCFFLSGPHTLSHRPITATVRDMVNMGIQCDRQHCWGMHDGTVNTLSWLFSSFMNLLTQMPRAAYVCRGDSGRTPVHGREGTGRTGQCVLCMACRAQASVSCAWCHDCLSLAQSHARP